MLRFPATGTDTSTELLARTMTDIVPHPALQLEDPTATRLVRRRVEELDGPGLRRAGAELVTSLSVVVAAPEHVPAAVTRLSQWAPERIRLELVAAVRAHDGGRDAVVERLRSVGCSWQVVDRPPGGRIAALVAAIEAAENEFVLVLGEATAPYELVPGALAAMWAQGADAVLFGCPEHGSGTVVPGSGHVDAADELADALGLCGGRLLGRAVLLRRWVARWLFNEATRAIEPAVEVADRARLLGIGVIVLGGAART